jgi:membrane protein DedA with SNARE-associated domain
MNLITVIVLMFGMIVGGIPMFHWGKYIERRNTKANAK